MLLLELDILHVEFVDAVNHGLDELHFGVAKPVLVRDVVGDAWKQLSTLFETMFLTELL